MKRTVITIIGMGPRGISVLERLAHFSIVHGWQHAIRVEIVDPGESGQGTHYDTQPAHLLTNTLASQVTVFPPDSAACGSTAPSFLEWAREAGYRHFDGAFHATGDAHGEPLSDQHYLPRHLLGRYFSAAFDRIVRALPANITVHHHRRLARDVAERVDGGFDVHLDGGADFHTDYLVLALGHGRRQPDDADRRHAEFVREHARHNDRLDYFPAAYPVERLGRISPDATVAVQGIGLTAHDVISHLTVGRGGRFAAQDGRLRYLPSGREPAILLFSRSGLPFSARAVNQKGAERYAARHLTMEAVAALRERALRVRGSRQIDFVAELMPLVMADMAEARHAALHRGLARATRAPDFVFDAAARAEIESILDPLASQSFRSLADFRRYFTDFLARDLAEANLGNLDSPVKAATDVLRDLREQLRLAAEYSGFTPESNPAFAEGFVNTLNRIVFGPPRHRNEQLLALFEQGFVDLAGGPGASIHGERERSRFAIESSFAGSRERRLADVLVVSRIDVFSPNSDSSELIANLLARGLIRGYRNGAYHPGGIDITPTHRVVGRDGTANPRLWAIGYPVEGPHYYTQELARPGRKSRLTIDAEVCVADCFASLGAIAQPSLFAARMRPGALDPAPVTE
ncbi:FAD/NAD(P)-binding protein [Burkholderia plantarii]|uniref:FAD/NAD(P)-binding protein n=1 Tax=Burkholderia plantarii TaxID=41899 RepID=UPI0018DEAACD|nr:FAD/NAD(P)-binding protein [Burkholderia plantarii]MBI0328599.1 FAD/NAD(P)-binding protein [Burkholderia plantarii]